MSITITMVKIKSKLLPIVFININRILITIVSLVILVNCKTITVTDDQPIGEFPDSIALNLIPAGAYSFGEGGTEKYIEYDFEIMKYPVTNIQYLNFLKEVKEIKDITISEEGVTGFYSGDVNWSPGYYNYIDFSDSDCRLAYYLPDTLIVKKLQIEGKTESYNSHPVTEVTWFGANAFAKYYNMRLPTNEEWEKAARANTKSWFIWGNEIDSMYANYKDSGDKYDNNTTPVGFFNGTNGTMDSYSPYGLYDMSGNVWEWTSSWYQQSPGKIIRGGSWNSKGTSQLSELFSWFQFAFGYSPLNSSNDIGFRCVKPSI